MCDLSIYLSVSIYRERHIICEDILHNITYIVCLCGSRKGVEKSSDDMMMIKEVFRKL